MSLMQHCARLSAILGLALLFALPACKKSDSITDPNPGLEAPVKADDAVKVTATITGTVIDENNKPVTGATVTSATYATTTDAMGNFVFKNISVSAANGNVTVVKAGYFKGIRSFVTEAGKNNYVKIQLIKQVVTGTVTASAGGVINTLDGASITFPANAFVTQSGAVYAGTVFVYAKWIDPTAANLPLIIPGDLRGIDSSNGEYILKSYGMVGAELQDNSGNILKLAPGKTATVSFPIPVSLQASAPQSIPLWHFDEAAARWKQEGTATKNGNNYTGQVNKFSFWNVDVPGNFITLDLRLINNANNLPLANTMVKITSLTTGMTAYDFTNDSGYVAGYVPKNQNLKLEVITGTACTTSNVVYTQNIGPYTINTSLGNVSVTIPANQVINFTATIVNCSNQPVTNGYLSLSLSNGGGTIAYTNATGVVNISLPYCGGSTSYSYTGIDLGNGNYSTIASGTAAGNTVNLGTITACGNTINTNGVYIAGSIDNNAVFWKDGVPVYLTSLAAGSVNHYAYATDVVVINNDVYALIIEEDSTINGYVSTLKVWKNGTVSTYTSGVNQVSAIGMDVYNGDVYVAGYESNNATTVGKLWKNGLAAVLSSDTFTYTEPSQVKVVNGDVYIAGTAVKNLTQASPVERPVYWKNGVFNLLPSNGNYSNAYGIDINNGDIYISGEDQVTGMSAVATYWKNGIKTLLPVPANYQYSDGYFTCFDNGNIYVAGSVTHQVITPYSIYTDAAYWKNSSPVVLSNNAGSINRSELYDIFVKNGIIYTVGAADTNNGGTSYTPLYFQNNIPIPLTGFNNSQDVSAYGIFVK